MGDIRRGNDNVGKLPANGGQRRNPLDGQWRNTSIDLLDDGLQIVQGFTLAVILGSVTYCSVFTLLSVATNRALIIGLVYVFLWEGAVTSIFRGTNYLSIRAYTMGLGVDLGDTNALNPLVSGTTALIGSLIVIAVATFLANRRLEQTEVREAT